MFQSARIRLTAWYLVIIASITIIFSAIIYGYITWVLELGFRSAEIRLRGQHMPQRQVRILLEDELITAKRTVLLRLIFLNGIILTTTGVAGYFLAGKTLKPIKDMMDEQKRFVADASHELRTPLTSMKSEIEVALRDKGLDLVSAKKIIKSSLQEIDIMKDLTDKLLFLGRSESNNTKYEEVDISEVINKAIEKNKSLAKQNKIIIKYTPENITAKGDPGSLIELVSILINNAVKYSHRGKTVEVTAAKQKRGTVIKVKDEGIGIRSTDIPRIFERFYRADTSRSKHVTEGFGLGLSIAKSITDLHKGEIKVESTPGKGSTFTVILP